MKRKLFNILMATVMVMLFFGCTDDPNKIISITNSLYLDIKTIVTDTDIQSTINPKVMQRLAALEQVYLSAANAIKDSDSKNIKPLTVVIISCADEVLQIINDMAIGGKYEKQIAAIRLSIRILRNHLQIE